MKIILRNYGTLASVGVYEHEKINKTKVIISAEVTMKNSVFASNKEIVDYDTILHVLKTIPQQKHFEYIEELAYIVACNIKEISLEIQSIKIKVQKCILGNLLEELAVEVEL